MLLKEIIATKAFSAANGVEFSKQNFENSVFNGCHDLMILCLNISDIAIITVNGVDYRSKIHHISKSEAIYLLNNSVLDDRGQK